MGLSLCNTKTNEYGREINEHGTALFPVACYDADLNKESVPWHWHDELEAVVVAKGSVIIVAESEKYILKQGEGLFINAGVLHASWSNHDYDSRMHSVVFHPRLVGGSIDSIFWQNYLQPLLSSTVMKSIHFDDSRNWHQESTRAIEAAWQSCVTEESGYEFQVRAELSQLILRLSENHPVVTKRPSEKALRDNERIKVMLKFIEEHFSEQLNVSGIAKQAMISESECLRCFKNTIGTSPIQYLKQFRIQKAAEGLIAGDDKITDISAGCGFQDTSYFVKTFRELKGCTPSEYRGRKQVLRSE